MHDDSSIQPLNEENMFKPIADPEKKENSITSTKERAYTADF